MRCLRRNTCPTFIGDLDSYNRMFFVYHSGKAETEDERVILIAPEKLVHGTD